MWKDIPNYEGLYQVNELGNIKSVERAITDSVGHKYIIKERILKTKAKNKGYKLVWLRREGKTIAEYVHRLTALTFIPNPNDLPVVNHKDGNKNNNSVDNLEWCTYSENNQHAYDTNLHGKGEKHYLAKLTEDDVKEIRKNSKNNTYKQIGEQYGVSTATIRDILLNRTWKTIS